MWNCSTSVGIDEGKSVQESFRSNWLMYPCDSPSLMRRIIRTPRNGILTPHCNAVVRIYEETPSKERPGQSHRVVHLSPP